MKIYRNSKPDDTLCVLALGSFDSLHIGHQHLLYRAREHAWCYNIRFGVYMFEKRPAHLLDAEAQKDVYTNKDREQILCAMGADFVYYEQFDDAFMQKSPEEFVCYLKEKLCVNTVVAGFNYRFGKNAEGDSDLLIRLCRNNGIEVIIVPAVCDAEGVVSSTRVRGLLCDGDVDGANLLLGRTYSLCGCVQKDRGVGRAMGIPTANLELDDSVLLPKDGVYMTVACIGGKQYAAVTNIGIRPTFGLTKRTVETHLIGYDGDLYGRELRLNFHKFLRDEIKFEDEDALKNQIFADKTEAERIFLQINAKN